MSVLNLSFRFADWELRGSILQLFQPSETDLLGMFVLSDGNHVDCGLWWHLRHHCSWQNLHYSLHPHQHCKFPYFLRIWCYKRMWVLSGVTRECEWEHECKTTQLIDVTVNQVHLDLADMCSGTLMRGYYSFQTHFLLKCPFIHPCKQWSC